MKKLKDGYNEKNEIKKKLKKFHLLSRSLWKSKYKIELLIKLKITEICRFMLKTYKRGIAMATPVFDGAKEKM